VDADVMNAAVRIGLLAMGLLSTAGCGRELDFARDDRVSIVRPEENATVALPLELSWTAKDFSGRFAVFVDRSPMRPGQDVRSLVPREDEVCRANPACPDESWLSARGVYLTTSPSLVVRSVADKRSSNRQADRHEVTIVLIDEQGRRQGEGAFIREFRVAREG
jgi:hypothetical protein